MVEFNTIHVIDIELGYVFLASNVCTNCHPLFIYTKVFSVYVFISFRQKENLSACEKCPQPNFLSNYKNIHALKSS